MNVIEGSHGQHNWSQQWEGIVSAFTPQNTSSVLPVTLTLHRQMDTQSYSVNTLQQDLQLATYVRNTQRPNAWEARIPVASNWNLSLLHNLCESRSDNEVLTYLTYGWPVSFEDGSPTSITLHNHSNNNNYLAQVQKYIIKELKHHTLVGPFITPLFTDRMAISPMLTREKCTSRTRRIIVNLSWPAGASVNDGIKCDWYLGAQIRLRYPTIDVNVQNH